MSICTLTLSRHQVPEPPDDSKLWSDWLRWLVMVMNPNDPQLAFAASLLSHALKTGHLTERQAAAAHKMINRVDDAFLTGDLLCLKTGALSAEVVPIAPRLAIDNTKEQG